MFKTVMDYISALDRRLAQAYKERGQVSPSAGLSTGPKLSAEEGPREPKKPVSMLAERAEHREKKGNKATDPAYQENLFKFLKEREGAKAEVYDDHKGFKTVGVGFNMDAPGARERFEKALPGIDFDAVYDKKARLNDSQMRALFDATIGEYEKVVDDRIGPKALPSHMRIALVSLAFNSPSLIGPNLTRFVKEGDWQGASEEILFRSNKHKHKGIQNRRVAEAQMFMGRGNPMPEILIAQSFKGTNQET